MDGVKISHPLLSTEVPSDFQIHISLNVHLVAGNGSRSHSMEPYAEENKISRELKEAPIPFKPPGSDPEMKYEATAIQFFVNCKNIHLLGEQFIEVMEYRKHEINNIYGKLNNVSCW